MALAPGTQLGPYEITAAIGAGGMSEVYRARDTRLGRDVAIKVSAEHFGERFSREAHAIAALNLTLVPSQAAADNASLTVLVNWDAKPKPWFTATPLRID